MIVAIVGFLYHLFFCHIYYGSIVISMLLEVVYMGYPEKMTNSMRHCLFPRWSGTVFEPGSFESYIHSKQLERKLPVI